jgi:hypothetical protein
MSSQVMWRQPWGAEAEAKLRQALGVLNCRLEELASHYWDAKSSTVGGVRDTDATYVAPAAPDWSSAMLPLNTLIGERLAAELSRAILGPAIVFLEYDQATWGYLLFDRGSLIDRFWSDPDVVEEDPQQCTGDVEVVSRTFGVGSESVAPYLRHITGPGEGPKVFPDDEFSLDDHWVRCDFMRRLGLDYPEPGKCEGGRYVRIAEPGSGDAQPAAGAPAPRPAHRRPWWRLWG